jgi:ABC-type molybdate transport system ATPase subunit
MQALIRADDRTVLIVGHNIRQLERICTRMLLLEHGRIKLDGDAPEVTHQFFQDSAQRRPALSTEMRLRPTSTTGEIDLTELKVNNTELTDEEITAHSLAPLKVHIHLLSRIAAKDVEINIGAHTPEMNFVFKSSNLMAGRHIDLVCGDNVLEITIDRLALAPGSYGVGLGIYDWSRKPLWSGTGLAWLNVVPAPDVRCVLPSATLCLLPSSWQTSPIGATLKESLSIVSTNV